MRTVRFAVETKLSTSVRARQLSSMFDAPPEKKCRIEWELQLDLDTPWSVGLVTGPSGSGKSTLMRELWGEPAPLEWGAASVIDDFPKGLGSADVAAACQAVGFNTVPAWMRPYAVLSNGEKFRVELARRLIASEQLVVMDEFTSVVDRQVAQIGAHAVQKYIRRTPGRQFVAVTCHSDLVDWLQPDWVVDMSTRSFTRRLLQRRPKLDIVVGRLPHAAWQMFAPFHYLTAELAAGARCYGLWANGQLASFAGLLGIPVSRGKTAGEYIVTISRVVTLPDWQGLGLAMALIGCLGAELKAAGKRLRNYPAHPAFVMAHRKSSEWELSREGGFRSQRSGIARVSAPSWPSYRAGSASTSTVRVGGRPCAVFQYCGPPAEPPTPGLV